MLLPFLHDNDGWVDRLAQLGTPFGDANTDDANGDMPNGGRENKDEMRTRGGAEL